MIDEKYGLPFHPNANNRHHRRRLSHIGRNGTSHYSSLSFIANNAIYCANTHFTTVSHTVSYLVALTVGAGLNLHAVRCIVSRLARRTSRGLITEKRDSVCHPRSTTLQGVVYGSASETCLYKIWFFFCVLLVSTIRKF